MSTRKIPGSKAGRCVRLTTYHLLVQNVKKIRGLNLPDPHGPVQACNGTALLLTWGSSLIPAAKEVGLGAERCGGYGRKNILFLSLFLEMSSRKRIRWKTQERNVREERRFEFTDFISLEASLNSRLGSRNVSREHLQNEADEKGPEYSLRSGTYSNASLSITNPTRIGLGSNPTFALKDRLITS
jgi:hypothetical protein